MLKITTFAVAVLIAVPAFATSQDCKPKGGGYVCGPQNIYIDGSKASSVAEANALAFAAQSQDQSQSQSSTNTNVNQNVNGGNSVSITNPKNTTSLTMGVGVNVSLPLASGVQMDNAIKAATWFYERGDACTAFNIMADAPRVRRLKIKYNCGDRG